MPLNSFLLSLAAGRISLAKSESRERTRLSRGGLNYQLAVVPGERGLASVTQTFQNATLRTEISSLAFDRQQISMRRELSPTNQASLAQNFLLGKNWDAVNGDGGIVVESKSENVRDAERRNLRAGRSALSAKYYSVSK